ncbi:MAG: GNAT family N-acetyltransferase [Haloplanus sp.]
MGFDSTPPNVSVRRPKPSDRRDISTLWNRRTGFEIERTLDAVFDEERAVYGLLATAADRIVGGGVVMVVARGGVDEYFAVETDDYPVGKRNAILHAGVVHEEWEGRGIGTELMRRRVELVDRAHDVRSAFGTAWLRPGTADASALFENVGFTRFDTVDDYYQRTDGDRDCPDCDATCTCAAAIYGRVLDRD